MRKDCPTLFRRCSGGQRILYLKDTKVRDDHLALRGLFGTKYGGMTHLSGFPGKRTRKLYLCAFGDQSNTPTILRRQTKTDAKTKLTNPVI